MPSILTIALYVARHFACNLEAFSIGQNCSWKQKTITLLSLGLLFEMRTRTTTSEIAQFHSNENRFSLADQYSFIHFDQSFRFVLITRIALNAKLEFTNNGKNVITYWPG